MKSAKLGARIATGLRAAAALFCLSLASGAAAQDTPPPVAATPAPTTPAAPPMAAAPTPPKEPAAPAIAVPAAKPVVPPPAPGMVRVRMVTSDGTITLDLDRAHAPLTTANFLKYADQHRFDGTTFYRADVVDGASGLGLIQGGTRGDPKRSLPPIAHEPTSKTGLAHGEGTISMALGAPGSARGDFFITTGPLSSLDAHPQATGDNAGFAAFGSVVDGMDVVRRILREPVGPGGDGAMRGQLLAKPVKIVTVKRGG